MADIEDTDPVDTPLQGNKILVIGEPRVGKKFLLEKLVQSPLDLVPVTVDIVDDDAAPPSSSPLSLHTVRWPLDTRYYTANLDFHLIGNAAIGEFTPQSLAALTQSSLLKRVQGLMLVYSSSLPVSFTNIQRWSAMVNSALTSDQVLLMVGNESGGSGSSDSALIDRARDWCIDHGIEHVSVPYHDATVPVASTAAKTAAERWAEEDDGIPRLISAFQANEWHEMNLKDRVNEARAQLNRDDAVYASDDAQHGDNELLSINARLAQEEEQEEAELEAHLAQEREIENKLAAERANQIAALDREEPRLESTEEDERRVEAGAMDEEHMERHMNNFEQLLDRMKSIRSEALRSQSTLSNGAGARAALSDAERRRRAEEAIMSMLSSMGLDDEDDDEP